MFQFCYFRLYLGIKTVSCCLLRWMAKDGWITAVSLHKSDPQSPSFLVFRKLVHAYTRSARIISTSGTIRCASNTSSTSSLLFLLLRHISMLVWVHNTTSQQYHVTFLAARCRGHTLEPKARISNAKKMTPETF